MTKIALTALAFIAFTNALAAPMILIHLALASTSPGRRKTLFTSAPLAFFFLLCLAFWAGKNIGA